MYNQEIIDGIRQSVDIVDVIGQYIPLQKEGNVYLGYCPFHKSSTPLLSVNRHKQLFHCFGCGESGTVYNFMMKYHKISFGMAIELLANQKGITLPLRQVVMPDPRPELLKMNLATCQFFAENLQGKYGQKGREYFKKRNLSPETISKFGLGYASGWDSLYQYLLKIGYTTEQLKDSGLVDVDAEDKKHDKFYNRVMFPILNIHNQVIGFGGRVIGDSKPKYLNTRETCVFDKRNNLYGLNLAVHSMREGFILCEGYMDVISMHQAGFDNAIASLGTAYTIEQAKLIKQYRNLVYLAYDSDAAGVNACQKAIAICNQAGLRTRVINMHPYKDPDEFIKNLGTQAYEERITMAAGGTMYAIHNCIQNSDEDFDRMVANMLLR